MTRDTSLLTVAFLEEHPKAAAALIQEFRPELAVEFFQKIPIDKLAPVINYMPAWPAARVLSHMDEQLAADVLKGMPSMKAESLLRLMTSSQRELILGHMDKSVAKSFSRKLAYPITAVGAWMDTTIPYFTTDSIVGDCLDLIKRQKSQLNGVIIVVDNRKKIVGIINLEKLLISEHDEKLINLIDKDIKSIPARATLNEVKDNLGWSQYPTLPVIDRNSILLGALAHHSLQIAPTKPKASLNNGHSLSLSAHMGNAFFISMAGLLRLFSTNTSDEADPTSLPPEPSMKKSKELKNET